MANARFTATLVSGHKGAAFEVPFDPAERWDIPPERLRAGRNGHRVAGKVNGVDFESAVVPRLRRFWLEIDDELRKQASLEIGSPAKITLRPAKPLVMPPSAADAEAALALTRAICLSLPDTDEKISWGSPTYRVHGRIFVMFTNNHHSDGRIAVWCAAPPGAQEDLLAADPKHFFYPPYVGVSGWIGINLDKRLPKGAIAALIEQAHRTIEQKRPAAKRKRRKP
jgi:predicted DNA-binding protein (MmcQ/YjbR family)